MPIGIVDDTGKPPSREEVEEALRVVSKYRIDMRFVMANPELGVQLGNVSRILQFAMGFTRPRLEGVAR